MMRRTVQLAKLALVFLLAACLVSPLSLSVSAKDAPEDCDTIAGPGGEPVELAGQEPHCSSSTETGVLMVSTATLLVGYQNRPCEHGRMGHSDHRHQYLECVSSDCTLCAYYSKTANGEPYWGSWIC